MKKPVTIDEYKADDQGSGYADVLSNPVALRALKASLAIMNESATIGRMQDSVVRHHNPPLVGALLEIESDKDFLQATQLPGGKFRRLKQAIGVACKLTVARHLGLVPDELPSGAPDQARIDGLCDWFTTARRYRTVREKERALP